MSAIGGGHGNISDELLALQSKVGKLCNEARSNRGVAKFGTHTINGVTYNIEVIKTGLFRPTKVTIKSKLKDRAVVKGNARKFSTSKQGDVRKHLRHAVLKNQWKAKGNFSMEQKAQLYSEARGHGTKKGSVDLEKFTSECLEMAKGAGNSITQRGEALLSLCIVDSNITPGEQQTNRPIANFLSGYGVEANAKKPVSEIVDGLLDAVRDQKLSEAEQEKAGKLLGKIYNDPNIPQSEKDKIAANVRNTVKSIACNMAAISSGAPPEVIEQLITGWGDKLPEGVIPQIKDPIANKMPWPGRVMYKPFTMEPDTKSAQDKRLTLDDSGRVQNDQKECALAGILGGPIGHVTSNGITVSGEIHEKTVYHDGQSYTAFLIFNHNNPNLPPTVIMDLDAFHSNGLGSLAHRLNTEIDTGLNDVEQAAFKTATDEDRAKLEKIKKQPKEPIKNKTELLSIMSTVCSKYEEALKKGLADTYAMQRMKSGEMVGVFSKDAQKNQSIAMNAVSSQAVIGLEETGTNTKKGLKTAIRSAIQKGYTEGMTPDEQAVIIKAAKIATGEDMLFNEILDKFKE